MSSHAMFGAEAYAYPRSSSCTVLLLDETEKTAAVHVCMCVCYNNQHTAYVPHKICYSIAVEPAS